MFLTRLTPRQKNSFLALATRMVLADGEVAPEEHELLNALKAEMGAGVKAPPEEIFGTTNPAPFDTRRSRLIAIWELMVMGFADEDFHAVESQVLAEACKAFRLPADEVEKLKRSAQAEARLMAEARALIDA